MVAELIAGLGAFKTMFDIAKSMKDVSDAVKINAAVAELWEQIITAQARYAAAIQEVSELKEQLARVETWDAEKQKYELKGLQPRGLAYVLKPEERAGKPPHGICAQCYERRIKSVLQFNGEIQVHKHFWLCPSCGSKVAAYGNAFQQVFEAS